MVDPGEQSSVVDPLPVPQDPFHKDEHVYSTNTDEHIACKNAELTEKDMAHPDTSPAEYDETESTDEGLSGPDAAGSTSCAGTPEQEQNTFSQQQEEEQLRDSGFFTAPPVLSKEPPSSKPQAERTDSEDRSFTTSAQALDAAEAARMKGNVAYSLGHLYNAISMYLLANRHLAYAATLESGMINISVSH
jgi:hypothetical protein